MAKLLHLILTCSCLVMIGSFSPVLLSSSEAQMKPPVSTVKSPTDAQTLQESDIEKLLAELNTRLKSLQQTQQDQETDQKQVKNERIEKRVSELTAVISAYEQILGTMRVHQSLQQEQQVLIDRQNALHEGSMQQKPPYTLSFYDSVLDDLASAEQVKNSAEMALRLSRQTMENLDAREAEAESKWRLLNEKAEIQRNGPQGADLAWQAEAAHLQLELSRALLLLEKKYFENHQLELSNAQRLIDINKQKINWIYGRLAFDKTDLENQLASLESRKSEVELQFQKATTALKDYEKIWLQAVKTYRGGESSPIAEAELKRIETLRKSQQSIAELLFESQRIISRQQDLWRHRYALLKEDVASVLINKWRNEVGAFVKDIQRDIALQQNYQTSIQSQIAGIEKSLAEGVSNKNIQRALKEQRTSLQSLSEKRQEYVTVMIAAEQLAHKLAEEIDTKRGRLTFGQRVSGFQEDLEGVWNYEIVDIDNRPVTVRKVIISVLILIVGIILAKIFIRYFTLRLLKFARFRETTMSAIQKVVSFTAYLLVFLFALRIVNIPLAAFAFIGGAVAIGVGFGAQNLINNFISGFIIMGERPINIGDLIEIDGLLGQVEEVGARCTRVRTGENIHILVPNSSFLEKNITNWTLSDHKIRSSVSVGVVYGSPVKEVENLLLLATEQEAKVLKTPKPFVLFNDFGDNALTFAVHFWIQIKRIIERREIESRLRFRIDDLFREAGIVIAFPQRDVHLDSVKPLEVKLIEKNR